MCKTRFTLAVAVLLLGVSAGQAPAAEDPNVVGWWTFDEGSGTVAKDSSGHGNNGTFKGNPQWVSGYFAGALEFNGSDAYLDCGNNPSLDLTSWTIAFWLKVAENKNYNGFVIKGLDAAENYEVLGFADGSIHMPITFADGTRTYVNTATGLIVVGQWAHFAYTYSSGKGRHVYKDGVQVFSDAQAGTPRASTSTLAIGAEQPLSLNRFTHGTMDDVRIYNRVLTDTEIKTVMTSPARLAGNPNPADRAVDIPRDASLSWTPGRLAATHDVYLGKTFADVNNASGAQPAGVLVSQGQTVTTYSPTALLDFGQTYYWRVDEVNKAPDNTTFKGSVWSFMAEPYGYPITKVTATASSAQPGMGPEKTVDGNLTTMWLSAGVQPNWIQFQFDAVYKLDKLIVWNSNQPIEPYIGFGAKDVTVEYSVDGTTWTALANVPPFAQSNGLPTDMTTTTVNFGGVSTKFVKLTINKSWGGLSTTGLAEVQFFYIPVQARAPQPATAATGVSISTALNWRPGREAASHQVLFGTDQAAVTGGTAAAKTVTNHAFDPGTLQFGTTYYWRVDEVNTITYPGDVWSFTTQEFAAVDDFESYNDTDKCIYDTWIDGYTDGKSGSTVGYMAAPFAETRIIHGGKQSMPMEYNNVKTPYYSEATRTFDIAQNWTTNGADTLALWFRGRAPGFLDKGDGTFTMSSSGTDIWNNGDQFRFAYKTLAGDGSMVARVDSIVNTNAWAKAGVMIRQSTDAGSTHAFMPITPGGSGAGNGASFQRRLTANGGSTNDDKPAPAIAPPYWVKIERKGNSLTGSISPDGKTWTQLGTAQTIAMTNPVLVGLAVCSHDAALTTVAQFSNVSTTGTVAGAWQAAAIGATMPTNTPAPLYLVVEDKAGKSKMVVNPNPSATVVTTWTEWRVPLSDLTGVNVAAVQKITLGVGDKTSPKAGAAGLMYFDDIGYGHPAK